MRRPVIAIALLLLILALSGCKSSHKVAAGDDPQFELPSDVISDWPDGIRLSNGSVNLLIVPSIGGRIMSFAIPDGPSVLWANPKTKDVKPIAEAPTTRPTWKNWGGDKAWPWPEGDWPLRIGRTWPPPVEVDQMPMNSRVMGGGLGVRMESRPIVGYGVKLVREIALDPAGGAAVTIVTRFESASADLPPPELAAWQITQVPAEARLFAKLAPRAAIVGLKPAPWEGHHAIAPDVVMIDPPDERAGKIGLDADTLAWAAGEILFVARNETATRDASHYRPGEQAQVFIQAKPNPAAPSINTPTRYVEFEFTSPCRDVAAGESPELRVTWRLYRRENGKWSDADVAKVLNASG